MLVKDVRDKLRIGQKVRTNGDNGKKSEMIEGEINIIEEDHFSLTVPKNNWTRWRVRFDNPSAEIEILEDVFMVGDMVKRKKNSLHCPLEGMVGEIGKNKLYIWQNERGGDEGKISPTIKGYSQSWSVEKDSMKNDLERVDVPQEAKYYDLKVSYTEIKPPVEGKKGNMMGETIGSGEMKEIVRKVYKKDSLETAELVDMFMTNSDLGQGYMAELALTEKKDVVLKEAKRRKKEREEREK